MDCSIEMYAPYGTPPKELTVEFLSQTSTGFLPYDHRAAKSVVNPAWIALVEILRRIEEQPYHWPTGRTIFQKLAYVATREGLPTGFVYQKSSFGPFSEDLKTAETNLVNNNLLQEERKGQWFVVKVGPNFDKVRKEFQSSLEQWKPTIDRIADLFMRINTNQAEIVATVIFAADILEKYKKSSPTETEVLDSVLEWKHRRRPPLDTVTVASTIRNLGMLGWLNVNPDEALPVPEEELVEA
jgi:uncharacterized protein YwgA